jgi:hypothetical protein
MFGFEGQGIVTLVMFATASTALIAYCFWQAPLEWKLLLAFCCLAFTAALKYPMVPAPQWPVLAKSPGIRYWYLPSLAFAWVLMWGTVATRQRLVRDRINTRCDHHVVRDRAGLDLPGISEFLFRQLRALFQGSASWCDADNPDSSGWRL